MAENSEKQTSSYNEAFNQIVRLNDSWNNCNQAIRKGELDKWMWELDVIYLELRSDITPGKISNPETIIKKNNLLKKAIAIARKQRNRSAWYEMLYKRHEFLKTIQENVGKGGIFRDTDEMVL